MKKLTCILLLVACTGLKAQQRPVVVNLGPKSIIAALDTLRNRLPIEKLYLQTDKPNYISGDTLWFKSYLLNADYLTPSVKSGLLYIELDNTNNQMAKRIMVPVTSGISRGDMVLNEDDVPQGSYTLRAYTNWMRNFGEDYIFKKNIYISAISNLTLETAGFKPGSQTGKNKTDAASMDRTVRVNRPESMDVQFMPEGGNLVAGIPTKVGFKAIGEDGRGADVSGKIVNSKNQSVTNIQTLHKGMGSFELTPESNENYTAIINLPNKTTKSYALPKVNPAGTTLRINTKGSDSLEVVLSLKSEVKSRASAQDSRLKTSDLNTYYLISQSRGVVCYAAVVKFTAQTIKKALPKALFPTGVARFTLLNQNNIPLNERIVYIDHRDNLNITVNTNKPNYTTRDSIGLNIEVKDQNNNPVHGTFSLAVTDNGQVKPDTTGSNIVNDLLFTSDLKGTVEEPGWYFDGDNNSAIQQSNNKAIALDNLLLTQGWVGYDWKEVFSPITQPPYQNEKEFVVQGKVTNLFGKGVDQSSVLLIGKAPEVLRDTMTDKDGVFTFKSLFPVDTAEFKLEARNKSGKAFNVGIEMLHEFDPPVFAAAQAQTLSGYINGDTTFSDTSLLNNGSTKAARLKAEANFKGKGHLLKEVEIKDKKIIPDSHNRNGPGEADETITENEIKQMKPKSTLAELLTKKYKSFRKTTVVIPRVSFGPKLVHHGFSSSRRYEIYGHWVKLFIDGMRATDDMMNRLTAEDIKGIEVMHTARYAITYDPDFVKRAFPIITASAIVFTHEDEIPIFLEITTYSGFGKFLTTVAGTYVYRALPFTLPKEFYNPRYTVKNKNTAPGTDLRSTIHWQPNIITDAEGKATVSFFSADKPADYTVIIEGTDLNGNLGYQRNKIKVVSNTSAAK